MMLRTAVAATGFALVLATAAIAGSSEVRTSTHLYSPFGASGRWGPTHGPEGGPTIALAVGALGLGYIGALAIAPGHVVYAGGDGAGAHGLYGSTDAGNSWRPLTDTGVSAIAIDPKHPATIYIGIPGGDANVFRSTDAGTSWQPEGSGLPTFGVADLAIDPALPTTLYATVYGRGVFRSTDSGKSWHSLNAGLSVLDVRALAAAGRTLYAGTAGGGVVSLPPTA